MKSNPKRILVMSIIIFIVLQIPLYVKALSFDDILASGNDFIQQGTTNNSVIDEGDLQEISNMVSGVLLTIAVGVTLISAVVMGINFTIQSVEDKAKVKESMIPWVIGIFVAFGAYGIWTITMNVFYKL